MPYKSKQELNMRARLNVIVFIRDIEGHWSNQLGSSYGVPSSEREAMFENAILNAVYKHLNSKGMQFANGGSYDYRNIIARLKIRNYWYEYFSENKVYSFKARNIKGKRYIDIRKRGKFYKRPRFTYSKKMVVKDFEI